MSNGEVMLVRSLIFLSMAGILLVACGDKDDDTGADTAEAVDTAIDDSTEEQFNNRRQAWVTDVFFNNEELS